MARGQRAQRVDQRRKRQTLGAELDAVPEQNGEPGAVRLRGELTDQPGLPDPRLAADDSERGLSRLDPVQQGTERRDLVLAPDEHRADDARAHRVQAVTSGLFEGTPPGAPAAHDARVSSRRRRGGHRAPACRNGITSPVCAPPFAAADSRAAWRAR